MAGKSRRNRIILLPLSIILFIAGWILIYLGSINYRPIQAGFSTEKEEMVRLKKYLANAIIEEREGIMLGFLGVFALIPLILFSGFPPWAYVSAGFFSVLGSATMVHGRKHKKIIMEQLHNVENNFSLVCCRS
jgi:hypothetical protein